jgi:DnaA N-terminal domain
MTERLEFKFRTDKRSPKPWAQPSWRGRRFRGIELDQQRIEAKAARERQGQARLDTADQHRSPSLPLLEAWAPVEDRMRHAVDGPTFRIWVNPLHPHRLQSGVWVLACGPFERGWVRDRFGRLIEGCAGRPCQFVVCGAMA